ncbi:tetratricopeptide repeat protein [Candidatus Dependentiae bacterium]|nr:tetratricopeptide repeat protein [Candidatus Dependentiae bacterium]
MCKNHSYKILKIITPIILCLITITFYLPTLWYNFIYDDLPTIIKNIHIIKQGNIFDQLFANNRWISRIINRILYNFWQTTPFVYRIINLSLHLISGILIFFILLNVLSNIKKQNFIKNNAYLISTLTTGLFLLHPVQTQTVPFITQMQLEGTVVLFTFIIIFLFLHATKTKNLFLKMFLYATAYFLTYIAAGTKEIIIVLPLLISLFDWFFIAQGNWKFFLKRIPLHALFFVILTISLARLNWSITKHIPNKTTAIVNNRGNILTQMPKEKITPISFFISQFQVILHYITIYFWPLNLCLDYEMKIPSNFWHHTCIIPFLILLTILLIGLTLFLKDNINIISFCIAWFFISVLPRSSFYPSTELVCDYKTYISSFSILLLISIFLLIIAQMAYQIIGKKIHLKKYFNYQFGIISLIILISGYATKTRNAIWSNELLFWEDVVKKNPNKARGYNNYAVALSESGQHKAAMANYKKSSQLDPTYAEPVINLAFNYQIRGDKKRAMEYYKKALNLNELHPEMYHNLGVLHLQNKSLTQAEICFKTAIKLKPYYTKSHGCLAYIYQQHNNLEKAFYHYYQAIEGDFPNLEHLYQFASTGIKLNKYNLAIQGLEKIKTKNSNYKDTLFLLASCYYQNKNYLKAAENFGSFYKQNPNQLTIAYNYAQALLNLNNFKAAKPLFEKCKNTNLEKFPYSILHYAKCLVMLGNKKQAIYELKNFINTTTNVKLKNDSEIFLKEIV